MAGVKLDWENVEALREAYEGGESQGSISRRLGVSIVTVGRIVRGESWQGERAAPTLRVARTVGRSKPPEDLDAIAVRVLAVQEAFNRRGGEPPVSVIDGGDAPSVTGGMDKLRKTEQEMRDERTL